MVCSAKIDSTSRTHWRNGLVCRAERSTATVERCRGLSPVGRRWSRPHWATSLSRSSIRHQSGQNGDGAFGRRRRGSSRFRQRRKMVDPARSTALFTVEFRFGTTDLSVGFCGDGKPKAPLRGSTSVRSRFLYLRKQRTWFQRRFGEVATFRSWRIRRRRSRDLAFSDKRKRGIAQKHAGLSASSSERRAISPFAAVNRKRERDEGKAEG